METTSVRSLTNFFLFLISSLGSGVMAQDNPTFNSQIVHLESIIYNYPDSALVLSEQLLQTVNETSNTHEIAILHLKKSQIKQHLGQLDDANIELEKVRKISTQLDSKQLLGQAYLERANLTIKNGDSKSALLDLKKSIYNSKASNDTLTLARSYLRWGRLNANNMDTVNYYYSKSYELAKATKDSILLASVISNQGLTQFARSGKFDEALEHYDRALAIFDSINYKLGSATTYMRMASIMRRRESYEKSIVYDMKNIEICKEIKYLPGLIGGLGNMGNTYGALDRAEDALRYRKNAIEQAEKNNISSSLPSLYGNVGASYIELDIDSAKYYLNKCIDISTKLNNLENLGVASLNLGGIYKDDSDFTTAEKYFEKSINALEKGNFTRHLNFVKTGLVDLYVDWTSQGPELSKKVDLNKMEVLLINIEENTSESRDIEQNQLLYKAYIKLGEKSNRIDLISEYQGKLLSLNDSLLVNARLDAANEWAEKLKTADKEQEIKELEIQNRISNIQKKNLLYGLIGSVFFFLLIGFIYNKYLTQRNQKQRILEAEEFRSKLSANIHDDVGSMLSNLALQSQLVSFASNPEQKEKLESIATMSHKAMESLRDTVWAIDARKDKYENLMDRMIDYGETNLSKKNIDLEVRKQNWTGKLAITPEKRQNIYLIFKEAITNIMKHSLGDLVTLSLSQSDSSFEMKIKDNGTPNHNKVSDGLGLSNMKMRANSLNGDIQFNAKDGFEIVLNLPL